MASRMSVLWLLQRLEAFGLERHGYLRQGTLPDTGQAALRVWLRDLDVTIVEVEVREVVMRSALSRIDRWHDRARRVMYLVRAIAGILIPPLSLGVQRREGPGHILHTLVRLRPEVILVVPIRRSLYLNHPVVCTFTHDLVCDRLAILDLTLELLHLRRPMNVIVDELAFKILNSIQELGEVPALGGLAPVFALFWHQEL